MPHAYYNEIDPYAADWLENLIAAGHIAPGIVDRRSIVDIRADDLAGYVQCHFFAGIGGWSLALRLAGWPDDRPVWTGSCPCQPFSAAGKGAAADDERHLWPRWFPLIAERRPAIVFGEQVEAAIGWGWLDAVFADLEQEGYACGSAVLPACSVGAPHIRHRCWFVADAARGDQRRQRGESRSEASACGGEARPPHGHASRSSGPVGRVADADAARQFEHAQRHRDEAQSGQPPPLGQDAGGRGRSGLLADAERRGRQGGRKPGPAGDPDSEREAPPGGLSGRPLAERSRSPWAEAEWLPCRDGKSRPVEPGTFPLAHGIPARVGSLRAYGNAIVPQVAAEFIRAAL